MVFSLGVPRHASAHLRIWTSVLARPDHVSRIAGVSGRIAVIIQDSEERQRIRSKPRCHEWANPADENLTGQEESVAHREHRYRNRGRTSRVVGSCWTRTMKAEVVPILSKSAAVARFVSSYRQNLRRCDSVSKAISQRCRITKMCIYKAIYVAETLAVIWGYYCAQFHLNCFCFRS